MANDSFSRWTTGQLVGIAFRVTPKHELAGWTATSEAAETVDEDELRFQVIEQLECYGITEHDVNSMKS